MKPLYRVLYVREGRLRGVTIAAPSTAAAHDIAGRLCRRWSDNGDWHSILPFSPKQRHSGRQLSLRLGDNN